MAFDWRGLSPLGAAMLAGAVLTAPRPAVAQRFDHLDTPPPNLAPGDRVRVWSVDAPRVTGTLLAYLPNDVLSVDGSVTEGIPLLSRPLILAEPRRYDFDWVAVRRIDVPNGRDVLHGVALAVGGAVLLGAFASAACHGLARGQGCGLVRWTLKAATISVPLGAVVGFLSTRWKRVY